MGYAEPPGQGPGESSSPRSLADSISASQLTRCLGRRTRGHQHCPGHQLGVDHTEGHKLPGFIAKFSPAHAKVGGFFPKLFFFSFNLWGKTFFQAFEPGTGCGLLFAKGILELEILISVLLN